MSSTQDVLIIGNCQTQMMVESLTAIDGTKQFIGHRYRRHELNRLKEVIRRSVQNEFIPIVSTSLRMETELIEFLAHETKRQPIFVPSITFSAFHPDIQFAQTGGHAIRNGLGGTWNSRLILTSYLQGHTTTQTLSLFCGATYQDVGYLDRWDSDVFSLSRTFDFCDLEFTRWFRSVKRLGVFMHGINHPVKEAIQHLAIQIAEKIGLPKRSLTDLGRYSQDNLSTSVWPIYPDIAEHFGFYGSYVFQYQGVYLDLEDFVDRCFASWNSQQLQNKPIQTIPITEAEFQSIVQTRAIL